MYKLVAYDVSIELLGELRTVVPVIAREDRALGDQLRRAASSVSLNLAEGARSLGGNKMKHYWIAQGSAAEVKAALMSAIAWGHLEQDAPAWRVLDRLLALLWGLTHPKRAELAA